MDINIKASSTKLSSYGDCFNIGTGNNISINELASWISDKIEYTERKSGELKHSCADIAKTCRVFEWKATRTLKDFLKK